MRGFLLVMGEVYVTRSVSVYEEVDQSVYPTVQTPAGHVDFAASIGAIIATRIEGHVLRRVFGAFLFLV
jgi:hypothetical protein